MVGLAEKLKDAVRTRSKHAHSKSLGEYPNGRSSGEHSNRQSTEIPGRVSSSHDGRQSRQADSPASVSGTTRQLQAMKIDDHEGIPASKTLPPLPTDASQRIQEASGSPTAATFGDQTPTDDAIPPRHSSLPRRPVDRKPVATKSPRTSPTQKQSEFSSPSRTVGHKTARSVDVAPTDPSSLIPRTNPTNTPSRLSRRPVNGHQQDQHDLLPPSTASSGQTTSRPEAPTDSNPTTLPNPHLRLPAGFNMSNSTTTHVETSWAPTVVREDIHRDNVEIVQPVITRDIHVDHYYHYVQPIKVTEVLPAKHYTIVDGKKVEIPAPEGWVMPAHMQPTNHGDLSALEPTTRHYVVDDQNPRGTLEEPVNRHTNNDDIAELQRGHTARTGSATSSSYASAGE